MCLVCFGLLTTNANTNTNTNTNANTNTKYSTKMSKLVDMANQSPDSQVAVAVRLKAACHLDGLIIRLRERNLVV